MRDDKPWCGRPLPLDADGWKTRAFAFKDALLETRQELAAATTRAEQAEQRAAALIETFNYLLSVVDEVARGDASRSALMIAVAQIQSGVAPGQRGRAEALAASGGAAPAEQAGGE